MNYFQVSGLGHQDSGSGLQVQDQVPGPKRVTHFYTFAQEHRSDLHFCTVAAYPYPNPYPYP